MTTTFTRESTTVVYRVDIDGAEPLALHPWSKVMFRPRFAEVTFTEGAKPRIKVFGPNVKKDGSDGQTFHDVLFYDPADHPVWHDALIDQLRPLAEYPEVSS